LGLTLRSGQARRVALAAQGFHDPPPSGRVDIRHLRRAVGRMQVIQIDSVNVLVRSHYLPLYSRLGPYPADLLDDAAYRRRELTEYWAHEASFIPTETRPLHRWVMDAFRRGVVSKRLHEFARDNRRFVAAVEQQVAARGPLAAGDLDDPGEGTGPWWGWAPGKTALEWLFAIGRVAVSSRRNFTRLYDLAERVVPREVVDRPTPPKEEAVRELVRRSVAALGVGTVADIADYFRLRHAYVRTALAELVDAAEVVEAEVEGWSGPAYAPASLAIPRRVDARALVSPFDPLVWNRPRAERLFGFDYRIEIYVPAPKRVYGYYVLPFLLGDRLAARVDLKADRRSGVLRVPAAWAEPGLAPEQVAGPLAAELHRLAGWLGLGGGAPPRRGAPGRARDPAGGQPRRAVRPPARAGRVGVGAGGETVVRGGAARDRRGRPVGGDVGGAGAGGGGEDAGLPLTLKAVLVARGQPSIHESPEPRTNP
jgi:uncharacterized protein